MVLCVLIMAEFFQFLKFSLRFTITFILVIMFISQAASKTISFALESEYTIEYSLLDDHSDKNEKNDKKEKEDIKLKDPNSGSESVAFKKRNSLNKILSKTPNCIEIAYSISSPPPEIN